MSTYEYKCALGCRLQMCHHCICEYYDLIVGLINHVEHVIMHILTSGAHEVSHL